jgi:hypothetical protein
MTDLRINVRDYGAAGDGTTDDSTAIKAAQAALTNNSVLYFPQGDYRFATVNPTGGAAVVLSGLSNISVFFDAGARLLMDNLDVSGHGGGHGILIKGACSHVTLTNPAILWPTVPSTRSNGDGIHVVGYPDDSAPPGGWTGSTGTVQFLTITDASVSNAPQTGAVIMGCSDVSVSGFNAVGTLADGLHFNACRRLSVNGHRAVSTGDDGLAFVTYYDATHVYSSASDGPFNQSALGEWNNSGSASNVVVQDGDANGVRVQGARSLAITDVTVSDCSGGIEVNSAIIGGAIAFSGQASQNIAISGVTIQSCPLGLDIEAQNINTTSDTSFYTFNVDISDVTIQDSSNWSVIASGDGSANSILSGFHLHNIDIVSGSGGGGNGGCLIRGLRNSRIDSIEMTTAAGADFTIQGADATRTGALTALPRQGLQIGTVINRGGRIIVSDLAEVSIGALESHSASAEGINLNRVARATVQSLRSYLPDRGTGLGRGVLFLQVWDMDVAFIKVSNDSHIGSSFSSIEVGGGDATNLAADGLRIEKAVYTDDRNVATDDVVTQGGPYAPVNWYANILYRHEGVGTPVWLHALKGDSNRPRVLSITSSATPAINTDVCDQFNITALAAAITSMTSGLTGTQHDGQLLDVRITGTAARAIAWGSKFSASGLNALLTTTATTKTHLCRFKYDAVKGAFVLYYVDATGY